MDENQLRALLTGLERRQKVGDRRAAILDSLAKAKLLTVKLTNALNAANTLSELEDIYLPLRPKRKTRASDARDKGLENLGAFRTSFCLLAYCYPHVSSTRLHVTLQYVHVVAFWMLTPLLQLW